MGDCMSLAWRDKHVRQSELLYIYMYIYIYESLLDIPGILEKFQ